MSFFKAKVVPSARLKNQTSLHRCLTGFDLILLGIGAIIGAGVFVLTGIAAATKAGPAITFSYLLAGIASMFAALAYAELATCVGGCGSAYNYIYTGFGELIAWIIGWNLLFEYTVAVSSVAIGWSGYVGDALLLSHIYLPTAILKNPFEGGWVNLLAVGIVIILGLVLSVGMKQSARFNAVIVFIKLLTIALFIAVAIPHVNAANWQPFLPFGWHGVARGAALVFFAYIGFDALSTAAEETTHPQRNLPIGIIGSMLICTLIYVVISGLLTAIMPYPLLNVKSPVADAMIYLRHPFVASLISFGAIAGLTTVMLVLYYGLTRITLAIARDGLLPVRIAKVHSHTKTPIYIITLGGILIALVAGLMPLQEAAELVNIGTLSAFVFVCAAVIVLRMTKPDLPRPFKLPFNPIIPSLGILMCFYLMLNLSLITWIRFIVWMFIGLLIYFTYGKKHSIRRHLN